VSGGLVLASPPAMPVRPARPLSTLQLLRVALSNSLAALDEELFEEPLVERRYIWGRVLVVSDPEGVRRVLQDNVDNYPRIAPIRRVFRFVSGTGMLSADGEVWRRHRRLLNPTLDPRTILGDLPALIELTEMLARELMEMPTPRIIDVGEQFTHLVTAFSGRVLAGDDRRIDPVLYRLGQYPGKYGLLDFLPLPRWAYSAARRSNSAETSAFARHFEHLIEERRELDYAGPNDLLSRIANARDRDTGEALAMPEMLDEALTLGATAATPLRVFPWLWYLLAIYPEAEARLHAELDEQLGGRPPGAADLPGLTYLRRVIDEVLRLYPLSPTMFRIAVGDDELCGRRIRRGTVVGVLPWVIHRHRRLWEQPDHFDPDRFLPQQVAARSRYAYLPFALGPHICIGAPLALMEITVAAAMMAQRFRFRLVPEQTIAPVAWTNLHPRGGIRVTVEPRG
jgi:cytochrome P450